MRKRSIVIVLAVALVLALAISGTAAAKYTKGDPELIDANCTWTHPDFSTTYTGTYTFHMEWSTNAGKPVYWEIYVFNPYPSNSIDTIRGKLSAAQIRAGKADITLSNFTAGSNYTFQVWVNRRDSTGDYKNFSVAG